MSIKKHFIIFILLVFLFTTVFPSAVFSQTEKMAMVAEGKFGLEKLISSVKESSAEFCEHKGGYLNINVLNQALRIEIDQASGLVAGVANLEIAFKQKCPGMPFAKLIKKEGTISAVAILSGTLKNGKINGTFNLVLKLPTLASFKTTFENLPWDASYRNNWLRGKLNVYLDQFEFEASFPFELRAKREKVQFISPASKKALTLKNDIAGAIGKLRSRDYKIRENAVSQLDGARRQLPLYKGPLREADSVAEAEMLFRLFEGYIQCVQTNTELQAAGNPQWEKCLFSAGEVLERAEQYAREARPQQTGSVLYFQIAQLWDRMRYFSMYAPKEVRYDKVENCQRAKKLTQKAIYLNRDNQAAKEFLEHLESQAGCQGMPLFGINREQIEQNRQKALEETLRRRLEMQMDENIQAEKQFTEKIEKLTEKYENLPEEQARKNTKEAKEENLKIIDKNLADFLSALNEKIASLPAAEREKAEENLKKAEEIKEQLKKIDDIENKKQSRNEIKKLLKEISAFLKKSKRIDEEIIQDLTNTLYTGTTTISDWENVANFLKNKKFADYNEVCALNDMFLVFTNYLENKNLYSHEDAVSKATIDVGATSLLTTIPIFKAAQIITTTPRNLLKILHVENDSDLMIAADVFAESFSPEEAISATTKLMTQNTLSDVGKAIAHQAKKVYEAQGLKNKAVETGKLIAGTTGGTLVAAARLARDSLVFTSEQTFGRLFGWLGSKFY